MWFGTVLCNQHTIKKGEKMCEKYAFVPVHTFLGITLWGFTG